MYWNEYFWKMEAVYLIRTLARRASGTVENVILMEISYNKSNID